MALSAHTNLTSAASMATNALHDIKPPMEIPTGWEWLWVVLGTLVGIGVLLGLIALIIILIARNRRTKMPSIIPAHVRAKQQLDEALKLLGQPKPFAIKISDTLRTYLEERFDFHAPERTTEEFLHELKSTPLLDGPQKESLGAFLQSCDLVKFARYEPAETELTELHRSAYRLVEETEPKPQAEGANQSPGDGMPPVQNQANTRSQTR